MSPPLPFCFVLHLHQPVGNFDHVFREHADDVYAPFLDFLEDRDLWPIGLHVSGPLLEWLGRHDVSLHDRVGRHAAEGRIELLSAGWYEPVLASLPRADRADQLGWMRAELRDRFGVVPRGAWLTERAWAPEIAADLAADGLEYTLIDDHLARRAGVAEADLRRPLRTESDGRMLDLLPIDEELRYLIPFRPVEEIAENLVARRERGDPLALFGDDGEKFGGWPRTRAWLYDGGWLEAFGARMERLRDDGIVRWIAPAAAAELPGTGPVYPPSGSYPEMESWAPGGHWNGFLGRYTEANRIHKRMLALSALCRERGDPPEIRRALGRAQCNDAYWHGVFGGLYMKHLREGVRGRLLEAERALRSGAPLDWTVADVDGDGAEEWWVHGEAVSAWVRADGTVAELVRLAEGVDVLDVLTRRHEAYHDDALRRRRPAGEDDAGAEPDREAEREGSPAPDGSGSRESGGNEAPSIHEIEQTAVLDRLPPVDRETRVLLRERVLPGTLDEDTYMEAGYEPLWTGSAFEAESPERVTRPDGVDGVRWTVRAASGPAVEKTLTLGADGAVECAWRWEPDDFPAGARFAPELSLGAPVELRLEPECACWRWPIVTTSKCPDGFEEIEQGVSVTPLWPIESGRARLVLPAGRRIENSGGG